jgi:hypothetical protein
MTSTVLSTTLHRGHQAIVYTRLLDTTTKDKKKHKLKIDIESDTYLFQSHARIHRWNGEEWKQITHIPFSLMKTKNGLIHMPASRPVIGEDFMEDVKELHRLAGLILE